MLKGLSLVCTAMAFREDRPRPIERAAKVGVLLNRVQSTMI